MENYLLALIKRQTHDSNADLVTNFKTETQKMVNDSEFKIDLQL